MKLWPFVAVLVSLVLGGIVHILVREPGLGEPARAGRELPRLPVDRIEAPLAPRFTGPLPTRVEGFHQELEKGPPLSYVRARLLEGDREMGARLLSALRQAAASAKTFDELWMTYGEALGPSGHDEGKPPEDMLFLKEVHDEGVPCAWLREWLSGDSEQPPLLTELLWRKLARCPGADTTALFAREDAPLEWVLDHHSLFDWPRFTPALEGAAHRILKQRRQELFSRARRYLSSSPGPAALALHDELWRQASDEQRARWEEDAASTELMRRREAEHPWKCPRIPTRPEGVDDLTVRSCIDRWAAADWAATSRFAMSAHRSPELLANTEVLGTLRNFSSPGALKSWAREQGLLPEAAASLEAEPESLYLAVLMRQAQRAFFFDFRKESFPRRHDDLLVSLSWRVRPALAGVSFEQLPPKGSPPELFEPPSSDLYTLRAYADGYRFSVNAQNTHALEDIGAVVGLLNQVLEARKSPHRFALLDTHVTDATVVFGPEAALREADVRGLWRLGDGRQVLAQTQAQLEKSLRYILGEVPF